MDKYAIKIVPISLVIDGRSYRDGIDITPSDVYELLASRKRNLPTTAAPSPGEFLEAYRELSNRASEIVCVTVCSEISTMYDSALQAKFMAEEEMPHVAINVVDSRTAGGAQGFVALAAASAAASGKDLAQVTEATKHLMSQINMIAVLDTLDNLARSGRIPRTAAWASSLLKIKPILTFSQGGIRLLERTRTKSRAVKRLLEIMEERMEGKPVHVNIMHANVPAEADTLKLQIESRLECVEVYITDFAPTMGVQTGPGVLALAFYGEDDGDVG